MTIHTIHERQQRDALARPLGCNGNCNQGRACDCIDDELPPDAWDEVALMAQIVIAFALLACGLGFAYQLCQ